MAVTAEHSAQLAVHQPIEQCMPGPQQPTRAAGVQCHAPLDRRANGRIED